jgi:hypothetical protein
MAPTVKWAETASLESKAIATFPVKKALRNRMVPNVFPYTLNGSQPHDRRPRDDFGVFTSAFTGFASPVYFNLTVQTDPTRR